MDDVDTHEPDEYDDEAMFLSSVVGEEHELLFLDSYLRESFRGLSPHGMGHGRAVAVETFGDGASL